MLPLLVFSFLATVQGRISDIIKSDISLTNFGKGLPRITNANTALRQPINSGILSQSASGAKIVAVQTG